MSTHAIIQTLTDKITAECKIVDREAAFDTMLDEIYSFAAVGGPFARMQPSQVLKEYDPTAYRCGVNDYADGEPWVEFDGETYQQDEVEVVIQEFKDELESELSELEEELEDELQDFSDMDDHETEELREEQQQVIDSLKQQIADKKAEIAAVEADPFF